MDRRAFLTGAAIGGAAISTSAWAGSIAQPGGAPALGDWPSVKRAFAIRGDAVHMAGFFLASHPGPVRAAIERHRAGLDADPHGYHQRHVRTFEIATREAAAEYLATDPDLFAMTDSTTMGIGLVYTGLQLRPGDEIVTDTHDHIVTHSATQFAADRSGASVRRVPLYEDPSGVSADSVVRRVEQAVASRTRLLALTWVHSGTGVKLPVRRIADVVARVNASRGPANRLLFALDGVHGFGIENVTVAELGCDFFIAGCHKWLFGPRGTGLVWAKADVWPLVRPTIPTFDRGWRARPFDALPHASKITPGGFHSFEHRWALAEAFAFHRTLGKARVAERVHTLNRRCKHGLARLPKVKVATPMDDSSSAGIVCFTVDGYSPAEALAGLEKQSIIASTTPSFYRPAYVRLAPSLLTLEDDVDRAVEAVARL